MNKKQKIFIENCLIDNTFKSDIDYDFYFDTLDDEQKEEFKSIKK